MERYPYIPFGECVLRTPCFPFSFIDKEDYHDSWFNMAIYAASPDLYSEKEKNLGKISHRMHQTLSKYWSRSCSRSTPFGLFASCTVGKTGETSKSNLAELYESKRIIRFDMTYLYSLMQWLESRIEIKQKLLFYPNDSIYIIGKRLRYVSHNHTELKQEYEIQEVDASNTLLKILNYTQKGHNINDIAQYIADDDITIAEANSFVEELIDNQILTSELHTKVTGDDTLKSIITILKNHLGHPELVNRLELMSNILYTMSFKTSHDDKMLSDLYNVISEFPVKFKMKYLLQTDMFRPSRTTISHKIVNDIQLAIMYLMRIHYKSTYKNNIHDFAEKFFERYGTQEVPLLQALDPDLGISYPLGKKTNNNNALLENIFLPSLKTPSNTQLSYEETIVLKKYINSLRHEPVAEVELDDNDIKDAPIVNLSHYVSTIAVICQIITDSESQRLTYLKSTGSTTAASLLGRFCYLDKSIETLAKSICQKEQMMAESNTILSEIAHLQEFRIGNISQRPHLRNTEIHYLSHCDMKNDNGIPASDLTLSMREGQLQIRSKTLGKSIIPKLSNAHNFTYNTLPVYRFLCEYQSYKEQPVYSLSMRQLLNTIGYVPRVKYRNVILSLQMWKVSINELEEIKEKSTFNIQTLVRQWKELKKIPDKVVIKENDNVLYIDFRKNLSTEIFYNTLKQKHDIILEEFFFDENTSVISDGMETYCGEFIIPFYRNEHYDTT